MNTKPNTVIVLAATTVFVVTVVGIVAMSIAIEDGARAATMIGFIMTALTTLIGFLTVMARQETTARKVEQIRKDTSELTNGLGDAKIRTAVADVLHPDMIDPTMDAQLQRDRLRRDAREVGAVLLERADL